VAVNDARVAAVGALDIKEIGVRTLNQAVLLVLGALGFQVWGRQRRVKEAYCEQIAFFFD
jgi:hypothetical protein